MVSMIFLVDYCNGWNFEVVVMLFVDLLYNMVYCMVCNFQDVEDLVQEIYLKVYKYYDKF